jgi:AbrB family looped-hinge helix DNA binding protein
MKKNTCGSRKFLSQSHFDRHFYGLGTVGEKGQIVIPAKAREELGVKSGDQFIFFGHGPMMHLIKADELDTVLNKMTQRFTKMAQGIKEKIKENLK